MKMLLAIWQVINFEGSFIKQWESTPPANAQGKDTALLSSVNPWRPNAISVISANSNKLNC